ncbi:MIB1 [Branchiostoma lanceolatum]|uniref:MIB1 protein n=1 Tax=Branchiostoma lanceolatum TaxID=7740 RepID=A0A8K0A6Y8_BRALA|nr:MIB1 [Branchiostoma lanceolatum]
MPLDTVLCLDTSGSMAGRGMRELKKAVKEFLLGVQETASKHNLRENVGVVEFGAKTRIVQPLTNNYAVVLRAVDNLNAGGTTPMFEGLMEALKEVLQNGGVLVLSGQKKMTPRVILMTDGHPDLHPRPGSTLLQDKENVLKAALSFGPAGWQAVGLPHPIPIACVGCGGDVDGALLQAVAKLTNGMYVQGDIGQLSEFFRRQVLLIRFAAQFSHGMKRCRIAFAISDMRQLRDLMVLRQYLAQMGESVDEEELVGLKTLLLAMLLCAADDDSDDEEQDNMPPLGSRVQRGRDWKWGNQDRQGTGTVVQHKSDGNLVVEWDHDSASNYKYRFGAEGARDVRVVDEPRVVGAGGRIMPGCRVVRDSVMWFYASGRDWASRYGDQDGGRGSVGFVYKVKEGEDYNVHVRWPNKHKNVYKYQPNIKEIQIKEEHAVLGTTAALAALSLAGSGGMSSGPSSSSRPSSSRPSTATGTRQGSSDNCSVM